MRWERVLTAHIGKTLMDPNNERRRMKNPVSVGILSIILIWAVIDIAASTGSLYIASTPTNATILVNGITYDR